MRVVLNKAQKEYIIDFYDDCDFDINKEWVITDNPDDDDLIEAQEPDYSFPYKLLIDKKFYDALSNHFFEEIMGLK